MMWSNDAKTSECLKLLDTSSTLQTSKSLFTDEYVTCLNDANPTVIVFTQRNLEANEYQNQFRQLFHSEDPALKDLKSHLQANSFVAIQAFDSQGDPMAAAVTKEGYKSVGLSPQLKDAATTFKENLPLGSGPYLAVWSRDTGNDNKDDTVISLSRRSVEAVSAPVKVAPTYIDGSTCLVMYWTDLKIDLGDYKNPNKHSLVIDQKATSVVCKDKLSADVSLRFTPVGDASLIESLTLNMKIENKFYKVSAINWWQISKANVGIKRTSQALGSSNSSEINPRTYKTLTAPLTWSFVCNKAPKWQDKAKTFTLGFENLQMEAFGTPKKFSRSVDCAGWFTAPILLGVMVAVLIISLLTCAIGKLMSINTMDRFDDPKGKGLAIPLTS